MGRAAFALLGKQREHFLGAVPGQTVLPEDRPIFSAAWKRLVSSGRPQRLEFRIRRGDGAIRWLESELTAVETAAGGGEAPDRFLSVTQCQPMESRLDPATVAPMQERLAQLAETGESAYNVRYRDRAGQWRWMGVAARIVTNAVGRPELLGIGFDVTRQCMAEAERDQAKAELAAMAAENGMALLPEDSELAEPLRRKFVRITEQAQRAGAIIEHMRIFGRRETGRKGRLLLIDAVDGARLILESRLRLAGIALAIDLPPDLPAVLAKALPVEQVLVNLLMNACDAYKDADPAGGAPHPDIGPDGGRSGSSAGRRFGWRDQGSQPRFRAFLHDKGGRPGNLTGSVDQLWPDCGTWRSFIRPQRKRRGGVRNRSCRLPRRCSAERGRLRRCAATGSWRTVLPAPVASSRSAVSGASAPLHEGIAFFWLQN